MSFGLFIGIDYSGAKFPESPLKGLQVYSATSGTPERVPPPPTQAGTPRDWCRRAVAEWLIDQARTGTRFIAGIDHAFSFPLQYFDRYRLASWQEFLEDLAEHWPTHQQGKPVESILARGPSRKGEKGWFRLTERWTTAAKSVFDFSRVPGIVAKSTHAGIPWLWHIRKETGDLVHFWPFDGWTPPAGKCVIAEVYPSLFRRRFDAEGPSGHELDAYLVTLWLQRTCANGFLERYLDPPLTREERETAALEGWILGVA